MSETPEIIEAEIAVLQEKLVAAQHEKLVDASSDHPNDEPVLGPEDTDLVAESVMESIAAPIIVAAIPALAPRAPHPAQTVPARWALQPLER